ncbi:MAG: hypothetical protein ACRCT8_05820 [Lacipirellulaceae bacterium]
MNALFDRRPISRGLIAACVVLVSAGCADDRSPRLRGAVAVNGAAVDQGEIRVVPLDGSGAPVSALIASGRYEMEVRPGSMRVEIQAYRPSAKRPIDPAMPGAASAETLEPYLPEKFNRKSDLTIEVTGDLERDFDLTVP